MPEPVRGDFSQAPGVTPLPTSLRPPKSHCARWGLRIMEFEARGQRKRCSQTRCLVCAVTEESPNEITVLMPLGLPRIRSGAASGE